MPIHNLSLIREIADLLLDRDARVGTNPSSFAEQGEFLALVLAHLQDTPRRIAGALVDFESVAVGWCSPASFSSAP